MAVRTNATNVKAIIEVDSSIIVSDSDLDAFITTANELVTEICTGTTNGPHARLYGDTFRIN